MTMSRSPLRYRPLAPLGLAAALVAYVGCNSSPTAGPSPGAAPAKSGNPGQAAAPAARSGPRPPFADWPEPAAALVV